MLGISLETVIIEGKEYAVGYKVLTMEHKSLGGLRRNPNIINYPINEWYYLTPDKILGGRSDWGGIWLKRKIGGARNLQQYMFREYQTETLVYYTAIDIILYANRESVKTNGIILLESLS